MKIKNYFTKIILVLILVGTVILHNSSEIDLRKEVCEIPIVDCIYPDEGVFFHSDNATFNITGVMPFHNITVSGDYVRFNDTAFYVNSDGTNVTLDSLVEDTSFVTTDRLLSFYTDFTAWFNITGFLPSSNYLVYKDTVLLSSVVSGADGMISFSVADTESKYIEIYYSLVSWKDIESINGSLYNVSAFGLFDSYNGSFYNLSNYFEVCTLNGSLFNISLMTMMEQYNGSLYNDTLFSERETINGSLYNLSNHFVVSSLNGSFYNLSVLNVISDINGSLSNSSFNWIEVIGQNGSIYNSTVWVCFSEINGSIFNETVFLVSSDINGSLFNLSAFYQLAIINGSLFNETGMSQISQINGSLYNSSMFYEWCNINGSLYNSSDWIVTEVWNGTLLGENKSWVTFEDINGSLYTISLNVNFTCSVFGSNIECLGCVLGFAESYKWEIKTDDGTVVGSTGWVTYDDDSRMTFYASFSESEYLEVFLYVRGDNSSEEASFSSAYSTSYTIPDLPVELPDYDKIPYEPLNIENLTDAGKHQEGTTEILGVRVNNWLIFIPLFVVLVLVLRASIKWGKVRRNPVIWLKSKAIKKKLPDGRTLVINKEMRSKIWKRKRLPNGKEIVFRIHKKPREFKEKIRGKEIVVRRKKKW